MEYPNQAVEIEEAAAPAPEASQAAPEALSEEVPASEESTGEFPAFTDEGEAADASLPVESVEKALRDTKAWATRLSQDNAMLRAALEAAVLVPPPALLSDPDMGGRMERTRRALEPFEEFGPLIELLDTVIRGVSTYEREVAHHALLHAVLTDHPDALELRSDEDFHAWAAGQPPLIQGCLRHSADPAEVSWAIGLYKRQRDEDATRRALEEAQGARRERMLHAASPSPQTGSAPLGSRFTRADIARMSLADYRRNEADINAAMSRGEIR